MHLLLLHIPQQHVGLHRLGHEKHRPQQLLQGLGLGQTGIEQVFAGIQDAHDIIHIFAAHREAGQAALPNGVDDFFIGIVQPDGLHVGAVNHDVLRRGVVELENVFDQFLFLLTDGAGLFALTHHQQDLALADFLDLRLRIDTADTQPQIGNAQHQPGNRPQQHFQHTGQAKDLPHDLIGPMPGITLGGQIQQRHCQQQHHHPDYAAHKFLYGIADRDQRLDLCDQTGSQGVHHREKAKANSTHPQGRTEVIGLLHHGQHFCGFFVAFFGGLHQFAFTAFPDGVGSQGAEHAQKQKHDLQQKPSSNRV